MKNLLKFCIFTTMLCMLGCNKNTDVATPEKSSDQHSEQSESFFTYGGHNKFVSEVIDTLIQREARRGFVAGFIEDRGIAIWDECVAMYSDMAGHGLLVPVTGGSLLSGLLVATKTPATDSLVIYFAPKTERNNQDDFFRTMAAYFSYRLSLFDAIGGVSFEIEGLETSTKGFGDEATWIDCVTVTAKPRDPFKWAVDPCCNIDDRFNQKLDRDDGGIGAGSGGGGPGSGDNPNVIPKGLVVDSTLTNTQKQLITNALERLKDECLSKWIVNSLQNSSIMITVNSTQNGMGKYSPSDKKISIKDLYSSNMSTALLHEMIHAMQDATYPGGISQYGKRIEVTNGVVVSEERRYGYVNIEFEVSLMVDIIYGYNGIENQYSTVKGENQQYFDRDLALITNNFSTSFNSTDIDNLKNNYIADFKKSYPEYDSAESSRPNNSVLKNAVTKSDCYK